MMRPISISTRWAPWVTSLACLLGQLGSTSSAAAKEPAAKESAAAKEPPSTSKPPAASSGSKKTARSAESKAPEVRASDAKSSERKSGAAAGSLPAVESAAAQDDALGLDPKRGQGARNVAAEPASAPERESDLASERDAPARASEAKEAWKESSSSGKSNASAAKNGKGKAASKGPRTTPDMTQRRQIALGPTSEDLASGKEDPELRSLRDAELVLFPQPLPGLVPGWSWDLPKPGDGLPEIVSGAPLALSPVLPPKAQSPSAEWLRSLSMPNLPVRLEDRVVRYLTFFRDSPSGRSIARAWAKKSGRYVAALRSELAKNGLPTDLAWLSLVESGYNPTISSPAGAAGLWQFTPDAGRTYGLYIDRWVDERLDPERSTTAACRYLSDLYRRFGTWELAMAAYNMGYGGLSRSIRKYNTNDFWELSRYEAGLPWETTLYVPKVLATALVMTNRRAFALDDVEPDRPERFETVLVGPSVLLEDVARMAGVSVTTIEGLNPQFLAGRTPPAAAGSVQNWGVRVPMGAAAAVRESLARGPASDHSLTTYAVRSGDSIESIALAHGATELQLRTLNRIDSRETLSPGALLLVPKLDAARREVTSDNVVVVPAKEFRYPDKRRVFYRVVAGDNLAQIARMFRVAQADLEAWNALDSSARLHSGMALQLFVERGDPFRHVRHLPAEEARILVAGSEAFFDYFEGQNGRRRLVVRARQGDTLASIGKRYGMTIGWMERINRRFRTDPVRAAEPIVVYTERQQAAPGDNLYVDSAGRVASAASALTKPALPSGPSGSTRSLDGRVSKSSPDRSLTQPSLRNEPSLSIELSPGDSGPSAKGLDSDLH